MELAARYLPDARQPQQHALLQRLAARRREIREQQWRRHRDLRPWLETSHEWTPAPGVESL